MSLVSSPVAFALLSLLFAALIDVVYRRYSRKVRSRGMLVLGMGSIWGLLQLSASGLSAGWPAPDGSTLAFGIAAGVMLTLSNLLLLESFTGLDVSLGSTIYRLNTLGVVALSVVLLGEPLGPTKLLGIVAGIAAALLLYQPSSTPPGPPRLVVFFWIAVLASSMRAAFGVTSKAGLESGASASTMLLIAAGCWMLGGFLYAWLRERRVRIDATQALYSLLAGTLVFLVANTLLLALERGPASVVVPIANLSFILALAISVATKMERLTGRKLVAVGFAGVAIVLLARVSS